MALATLSIDLEARLAKFEGDMGKATRILQKLGDNASTAGGRVAEIFAGSFLASAAQEGLQRLIDLFPKLIDGVAAFQDLADETGASAEGLAKMQTAADVSGVSVENLAGMMVKLTGNLSKLTDDSKGAGLALTNLGIPLKEFRELSPDQQVARLSVAFNSFADGSSKTSNALALFGKSGAQALKFFKEYGDGTEQATRLTGDMIRAADAFGDASAKSSSELRQTAQVIALNFLPALTVLKGTLGDVALEFIKTRSGAKSLADDKALQLWGLDVAEAMAGAVDVMDMLVRRAYLGVSTLGAAALAAKEIVTPSFLRDDDESRMESLSRLWKTYSADVTETLANQLGLADKVKKRADAARATMNAPESLKDTRSIPSESKPQLKPVTVPDKEDGKAEEAFRRFMAKIEKRKAEAQGELDLGQKLVESDKFRIDVLADLGEAQGKLAAGASDRIKSALNEAVAVLKLTEAQQSEIKRRDEQDKVDEKSQAATLARIDALAGENAALELNIEEIGLTIDAIEKLRVKRLEASLVSLATDEGANRFELDALRRKIKLTQDLIDKRNFAATDGLTGASDALGEYLDKIAKTGDATREAAAQSLTLLEDDLTSGLRTGQLSVKRTVDFMLNEFLRLQVVRPLLKNLFGDGSAASSFFSTLFSGSAGATANARGNAFGASGLIPFAAGGVVNSATPFSFGGGRAGVMGEAGPEGILPLKRGRDGKLGVTASGGARPVVFNNTFNVNGDVGPQTVQLMQTMIDRSNARLMRSMRTGSTVAT